jgi:hypothetical protein
VGGLGGPLNFLLLSDKGGEVADLYGLRRPEGDSLLPKAAFILDNRRLPRVLYRSFTASRIQLNVDELLRRVRAVRELALLAQAGQAGQLFAPAAWQPGHKIVPSTPGAKESYYKQLACQNGGGQAGMSSNSADRKQTTVEDATKVHEPIKKGTVTEPDGPKRANNSSGARNSANNSSSDANKSANSSGSDAKNSTNSSSDVKKSPKNSYDVKKSANNSSDVKKSENNSSDAKKSANNNSDAKKSANNSPDAQKSVNNSSDAKKSANNSSDAKKSANNSSDAKKSANNSSDAKKSVINNKKDGKKK